MSDSNISLERAAQMIFSARNLLIFTHEHPDGDTLGSAFALKHALSERQISAYVVCCDPVPQYLQFVTDGCESLDLPEGGEWDLICAVDLADPDMLGRFKDRFADRIDLKIDHHRTSVPYAKFNYVDPEAAACGEIIFDLLAANGDISAPVADALFTAISSDTGCFRYSNTTSATHEKAAALIDCGARAQKINHLLFEQKSPGELRALKLALDGLTYYADGRIAATVFTLDMKREFDLTDDDISPLYSLSRDIYGVDVGITVRQKDAAPDVFKASLRSDGTVDCAEICRAFGGGGHKGAAGCRVQAANSGEAVGLLVAETVKYL